VSFWRRVALEGGGLRRGRGSGRRGGSMYGFPARNPSGDSTRKPAKCYGVPSCTNTLGAFRAIRG